MAAVNPVNSPIQVVLNASAFVNDWKRPGGGGESTDFYKGRDAEFVEHQRQIVGQMAVAKQQLARGGEAGVGYVKVSVRHEALAKTHRPVKSLFRSDRVQVAGGDGPGQLVFAVTADAMDLIVADAVAAEQNTRYKEKRDPKKPEKPAKIVANPSRPRSELGAIERVTLWESTDRRRFSVEQAVAWLSDSKTGGYYLVELFDAPPGEGSWDLLSSGMRRLFTSFSELIQRSGPGTRAMRVALADPKRPIIAVWLLESDEAPVLLWEPTRTRQENAPTADVSLSLQRHQQLLEYLDTHPLVKRIHLPQIVQGQNAVGGPAYAPPAIGAVWRMPARDHAVAYPKVAVVDGGFSPFLADWVIDRWEFVAPADESLEHATFIGGLLVGARSLNGSGVLDELDGCELIDIKLLPTEADATAFGRYYGKDGAVGFMQELADAVGYVRQTTGVRVFNLSANFQSMVNPARYDPITAELDHIAEANDAIFVISAGNADDKDCRPEWSADPVTAMADLAAATSDRICSPAESIRNVSVAALNPPHMTHVVPSAPAAYSRRGPGLTCGLKPDVAHVGGASSRCKSLEHGLLSISPNGHVYSSAGTSYAAPLVAKTLAAISHLIEGHVSRETLIALLVHRRPPAFSSGTIWSPRLL